MSNQDEVQTGQAPSYPSARRSIHDRRIVTTREEMGRYGMKKNDMRGEVRSTESIPQDEGTDETDNAMSKFPRHSSPMPLRQTKAQRKDRRNSFDTSDDNECDSDFLAKSLPAYLPSYYCSDENTNRSLEDDFPVYSESRINTQVNKSSEYNHDHRTYVKENQVTQNSGISCTLILLTILGVFSLVAAIGYNRLLNVAQGSSNHYDDLKFNKDMNNLGKKYKINDNSILEVQSGISTILERNDSGSFIFLYNGQSVNFDYLQFSNFMQDIASTAARYLRNETMSNQPTVIHSSELDMQNHSELLKKYRPEVAKSGVMLVKDVDRIPSSLAMAFHYFCDEYNPLVAKSAIFFTLNLANCSNLPEHKSIHNDVEKCLATIWNKVPKDNIKPLLTRVVGVVIDVSDV